MFLGKKPRIYAENATDYANNGKGYLTDAQTCKVTEKLNGGLELEMSYPISGNGYENIKINAIIYSPINPYDNWQPFRIYNISRPQNGIVKVNAEHKCYELSGYPCLPNDSYIETAGSATQCLAYLESEAARTASALGNPAYTFETDILTSVRWSIDSPTDIWSVMAQVAKWYNGEWKYDGTVCRLCEARGQNRPVKVQYGSNLSTLTQDEIDTSYTHIMPYWTDGTTTVYVSGYYIAAPNTESRMQKKVLIINLSSEFDSQPTEQELEDAGTAWMTENPPKGIEKSLKVTFVARGQTIEGASLGDIDHVELGDTIDVSSNPLNVNSTLRCITLVYDVLRGVYSNAELGVPKSSLATAAVTTTQKSDVTVWVSTAEPTEGYKSGDYWIKIDNNVTRAAQALGRYTGGNWLLLCEFSSSECVGKFIDSAHTSIAFNDLTNNSTQSRYDIIGGKNNTLTGNSNTDTGNIVGGTNNTGNDVTASIIAGRNAEILSTIAAKDNIIAGRYFKGTAEQSVISGYWGATFSGRYINALNSVVCGYDLSTDKTEQEGYGAHGQMAHSGLFGLYHHAGGLWGAIMCGNGGYAMNTRAGEEVYSFIIGDGSWEIPANSFTVARYTGNVRARGTITPGGADYSETYEWLDGNPKNEDRRGLFVTLEGKFIRLATSEDDYILGAISATPSICGDTYDMHWQGKYQKDIFGVLKRDKKGNLILSEDFDPNQVYIPQSSRREKAKVGTHGKLVIIDDGTCQVNHYCKPAINGIGTHTEDRNYYRVLERLDNNHIRIVIK